MFSSIISILKKSSASNNFATQFSENPNNLKLFVDPSGELEWPLSTSTAKGLIRYAQPAKFGLREKTLYNPSVRHVWEIPNDRIRIDEPVWNRTLIPSLQRIQKDLGLPVEGNLKAELHNLLVYEAGQFFMGHQDSEKTDGMVATLVVLLPSGFSGGEFIVDQHGDKQILGPSPNSSNQLTFMAFYADCHHEVKEITAGYRIALTYNLIFEAKTISLQPKTNNTLTEELNKYFSRKSHKDSLESNYEGRQWLVYLLDHEYSQRSLVWYGLKGADRVRAEELLGAARSIGLTAHLTLADIQQTWSTEDHSQSIYWNRHSRYSNRDDNTYDDDSINTSDYVVGELLSDGCELYNWVDISNQVNELSRFPISIKSLCWTKAFDEFKPFESDYQGYMGNYGNTLEHWYHRAAIVLWKSEFDIYHLFMISPISAFKKIDGAIASDKIAAMHALNQIMPLWSSSVINDRLDILAPLALAIKISDSEIAFRLLAPLDVWAISIQTKSELLSLANVYGETWLLNLIDSWKNHRRRSAASYIKDLVLLSKYFRSNLKQVTAWLLDYQLSLIVAEDSVYESRSSEKGIKEARLKRTSLCIDLLKAIHIAGYCEIHKKGIKHIIDRRRLYLTAELLTILQEILQPIGDDKRISTPNLEKDDWGISILASTLKSRLEKEVSNKRNKNDWSIYLTIPCSCEDCRDLKSFLADSKTNTKIWPLAKARRQHIHQIVDEMDIPVTHVTEHIGSPHKLVLTKTLMLFKNDDVAVRTATENLERLKKLNIYGL